MPRVAVVISTGLDCPAAGHDCVLQAKNLANSLKLPILASVKEPGAEAFGFLVRASGSRLELIVNHPAAPGPLVVDFDNPSLEFRSRNDLYRQSLLRAVGVKPGHSPRVLDATAGLGRDAYLLATAGCSLHLLEQNPVIHAVLLNGLIRGGSSPDASVRSVLERMTLSLGSLADFTRTGRRADVVYLDPMFPARTKSARVKKDMWLLQQFFHEEPAVVDEASLLRDAQSVAQGRVVVKRPARASDFADRKPTFRLEGRSSRYDVYETGRPVSPS